MGIPGLAKFINNNSDRFLRRHELKDTYVVIDGNNLSSHLYIWHTKSFCAFGGDYDLYDRIVRDFFNNLRKCNITPIVIFDGGYEEKKLRTIHKRTMDRMMMLMNFNRKHWSGVIFPLLLNDVFCSVLQDLNIVVVQCFFEADREIAAVARHLNCPVLSYDSDFFIFDVLYIPFDTVDIELKQSESGCYIDCAIYDVTVFIREFEGLDKPLLPLLAALLGNDYIDNSVFKKFFNHVIMPNSSCLSYSQRKIKGILDWLKSESLDSAISLITSHIEKNSVNSAVAAIKATIEDYKRSEPVILPLLRLDSSDGLQQPHCYEDHELIKRLPDRFIQLFQKCKLMSSLIDMIHLKRYYLKIQVEDVTKPCSQCIAFPIISAIHKILNSLIGESTELNLYMKNFRHYSRNTLNHSVEHCFTGVNVKNIMSEPTQVKINVLYKVLSLTNSDVDTFANFDNNWIIFIICFVFWMKNVKATCAHFHSIFLMAVANYVQTRVGHYKSYSCFMRHKGGLMNRLSKNEIEVINWRESKFSNILNAITEIELLRFTQKFIKLRQYEQETTSKGYFMATIHLFASFQGVLKHVSELNALMDFPLPEINFSHFYSGTILYNLFYLLHVKGNATNFALDSLKEMPNIKSLYLYLMDKLALYIPEHAKPEKMTRPQKSTCPRSRKRR